MNDEQPPTRARLVDQGLGAYAHRGPSLLGLLALDADGVIVYASPLVGELTGLVLGDSITDAPETPEPSHRAAFGRAWADRDRAGGATVYSSDGPEEANAPIVVRLTADVGGDGYLGTVHAVMRPEDIDRRSLRAQKMETLGALAGGVAHDFNNLLAAIIGNSELAGTALATDPDRAAGHLEKIDIAAEQARDLCDQLLRFTSSASFAPSAFDLSDLVLEMTDLLRVAVSKTARIDLDLAEGLPPVAGDPTQVRQVVLNVLTNASEALQDVPGTISLVTSSRHYSQDELRSCSLAEELDEGEYVALAVSDDGCGMDPDAVPSIFQAYYTTKPSGHGLGMAVVGAIMRAHRGAVDIRTELDAGTTVTLLFPATPGPANDAEVDRASTGRRESRFRWRPSKH